MKQKKYHFNILILFIFLSQFALLTNISAQEYKILNIGVLKLKHNISSWDLISPIQQLLTDPEIDGIVLNLDIAPNYGTAYTLFKQIQAFKETYHKPIIAYSETHLINNAYLIACATDLIMTSETADIGAFGFWREFKDQHEKDEDEGIKYQFFSCGEFKLLGDPHVKFEQFWYEIVQEQLDSWHNDFISSIESARPTIKSSKEKWNAGQNLSCVKAQKYNLIDDFGDQIKVAQNLAKLAQKDFSPNNLNFKIIELRPMFSKEKVE